MHVCIFWKFWNVKLYDYPELILIFYRLVTFKTLLNTLPSQDRRDGRIWHDYWQVSKKAAFVARHMLWMRVLD